MFQTKEIYNQSNLALIKSLDEDSITNIIGDNYSENDIKEFLKLYKRLQTPNDVKYNYSKNATCGRLYANKLSLQNCPKPIRALLCEGLHYHDYDLVNAHYNITLEFCKKNNVSCCHIEKYCDNRQDILDTEYQTKHSMLMFLYQDKPKVGDSIFLKGLLSELNAVKKIMTEKMKHLISTTEKKNKLSSLFSKVVGIRENELLKKVITHFSITSPTLVFDGFMTREEYSTDEMEEITGYKWEEKQIPIINTDEFKSLYQFFKEEFEENAFWTREPLRRYIRLTPAHPYVQQSKADFIDKLGEWGGDMIQKWEKDPQKRSYDTCVFNPDPNFDNQRIFNTFKPFDYKPLQPPQSIETPLEFIELVSSLCNYQPEVQKYLMSYIAHLFQKPHENPHTAIVLKGNQGTGKDTLTHIIEKLMGNNYLVKLSDMGNLVGGFNECLHNKLVVQINEMSGNDGYAYKNKIKDMITTETNVINRKYLSIDYQDNYIRWFMFSNNLVPVVIENTDRRFMICETADDYIGKSDYWNSLYKNLEDPIYLQQILTYLHNYDISKWRANDIPKTKDKRNLQINNNNPIHLFIAKYDFTTLTQATIKAVKYSVISCQEFYDEFKMSEYADDKKLFKSNYFKKQVSALKSIDIKRIKAVCTAECFAIDVEKVKKELTYYISEAEEIEVDNIKRPLIFDSDEEA